MNKLNHFYTQGIWKALFCVLSIAAFSPLNAQEEICTNTSGVKDNYSYELWKQETAGDGCMTLKEECQFSCVWSENTFNFLARRGLKFDETKTPSDLGIFTASYVCDYKPSGNSYMGVYGWTVEPLVEFYIIESWGTWRPPGATSKGTITIDGGEYDVYETTRTEQPSIKGTATFQQYWSVRKEKRTSGKVSISQHFDEWAKSNMNLGFLYDMNLLIEGYKSSGAAEFTSASLKINEDITAVETNNNNQLLAVYPSKVSDILNVDVSDSKDNDFDAVIYNVSGVALKNIKLNNGQNSVNVEELQKGVYFIAANLKNEVINRKFVK